MAAPVDEDWGPAITEPTSTSTEEDWGPAVPDIAPAQEIGSLRLSSNISTGEVPDNIIANSKVGKILEAFGHGADKGWGTENLGFSKESEEWLRKVGVFNDYKEGPASMIKAFNEGWMRPAAGLLDLALVRLPMGITYALGHAALEAGVPRDIVALPGMFQGAPVKGLTTGVPSRFAPTGPASRFAHTGISSWLPPKGPRVTGGLGDAPSLPVAQDLGIIGPERPSIREGTPAEAAANLIKPIEADHASPYSFDSFSMEKIGTGQGAATYSHGIYFSTHPDVHVRYLDEFHGDKIEIVENAGSPNEKRVPNEPYNPRHIAARVLSEQADLMLSPEETRQTAIGIQQRNIDNPALSESRRGIEQEALDILKSGENLPPVEISGAVSYKVRIHANPDHLLDWDKPLSEQPPEIQKALRELQDKTGVVFEGRTGEEIIRRLQTSARKGEILDRNGVWTSEPDRVASETLADAGIPGVKYLDQGSRGKSDAAPTHNYVIYDDSLIEITHKNGVPVEPPPRAAPATAATAEKVTSEGVFSDKAGNIRLDLITAPEDVKNVIRATAEENSGFMPARRGEISKVHIEALSEATGIPSEELNLKGIGRTLRNDDEVRIAITTMIQSAEDTAVQMKKAATTGAEADLIELQRLRIRHSVIQEQVSGLTAEWGRTGNVFQEFGEGVKDAKTLGEFLKERKGESLDDLRALAKAGAALDPRTQLPKFLHASRQPTFWDRFIHYWINSLLSGPFSHIGYAIGDATFMAYEAAVVTPIAGVIGKGRQLLAGKEPVERVYVGEGPTRIWGFIKGTEDAIKAASTAFANDIATPLPRQVATGVNPVTQHKKVGGVQGAVIGIPGRALSFLHSFFEHASYRSEIEAQAYRQAAKEGFSPTTTDFWTRKNDWSMTPTEAMMDEAVKTGQRYTFSTPLGPMGKDIQRLTNVTAKPLKVIVPFLQAPINVFKAALEGTAMSVLNKEMRANLRGENGEIARDTQWARLVAGSMVTGYIAHLALSDVITGSGPSDPKARALWLTNHKPNSVNIGGYWIDYSRFGPLAGLLNLGANLTDVHDLMTQKEYAEAVQHFVKAGAEWTSTNIGLKGINDLIKAREDPDRYGQRYINNFAASFIPYSSLLGQTANMLDPVMRDATTLVDAFKNKIPVLRETLLPVRDWSGVPIVNPRSEAGALAATALVNKDPVDAEMQRLNIWPTKVAKTIRGVELTPEQYDRFQDVAGALTRPALNKWVQQPGWYQMPPFVRENIIKNTISATRSTAAAAMQMEFPELFQKAVQSRVEHMESKNLQNKKLRSPLTGYDVDNFAPVQ